MIVRHVITFFVLLLSCSIHAHDQHVIDSLKTVIEKALNKSRNMNTVTVIPAYRTGRLSARPDEPFGRGAEGFPLHAFFESKMKGQLVKPTS